MKRLSSYGTHHVGVMDSYEAYRNMASRRESSCCVGTRTTVAPTHIVTRSLFARTTCGFGYDTRKHFSVLDYLEGCTTTRSETQLARGIRPCLTNGFSNVGEGSWRTCTSGIRNG